MRDQYERSERSKQVSVAVVLVAKLRTTSQRWVKLKTILFQLNGYTSIALCACGVCVCVYVSAYEFRHSDHSLSVCARACGESRDVPTSQRNTHTTIVNKALSPTNRHHLCVCVPLTHTIAYEWAPSCVLFHTFTVPHGVRIADHKAKCNWDKRENARIGLGFDTKREKKLFVKTMWHASTSLGGRT